MTTIATAIAGRSWVHPTPTTVPFNPGGPIGHTISQPFLSSCRAKKTMINVTADYLLNNSVWTCFYHACIDTWTNHPSGNCRGFCWWKSDLNAYRTKLSFLFFSVITAKDHRHGYAANTKININFIIIPPPNDHTQSPFVWWYVHALTVLPIGTGTFQISAFWASNV